MDKTATFKKMFEERGEYNAMFRKKTYIKAATTFCETYFPLFEQYTDVIDEAYGKNEYIVKDVAKQFVEDAILGLRAMKRSGRMPGGRVMSEVNIFAVTYVFPAIIATRKPYSEDLAEEIVSIWNGSFKRTNLSCSDFDSIEAGFQTKFMGMPVSWGEKK